MIKILVASETDAIRSRLVRLILTQKNNRFVEQGRDIKDVLDEIGKTMFDVIIFDINVHYSCLVQILYFIKQKNPQAVMIYLSDVSIPTFQQRCLNAGVDHFLEKSTEFEKIIEIIDQKYNELEKDYRLAENR